MNNKVWSEDDWSKLADVLRRHSKEEDGHIIWTGCHNPDGYGACTFRGKRKGAHRWALILKLRDPYLPEETIALHKCAKKNCLNPDHLEPGDVVQNQDDRVIQGTSNHGERSASCSITVDIARQIKYGKSLGDVSDRAKHFNVTKDVVRQIDRQYTWAWLGKTETDDNKTNKSKRPPLNIRDPSNEKEWKKGLDKIAKRIVKQPFSNPNIPELTTDCWIWTGQVNPAGYGRIGFLNKTISTHKLSYMCANKISEMDESLQVSHKCGVSLCCNSDHLIAETMIENNNRKTLHGTLGSITEETARQIKLELQTEKNCSKVAKILNVSRNVVQGISIGKTWKHVLI